MINFETLCPVCDAACHKVIYDLTDVPVHLCKPHFSQTEAVNCVKSSMRYFICENCGYIFNADFEPEKIAYDQNWGQAMGSSKYYVDFIENKINSYIDSLGIKNKSILEIGSGKGYFLKELVTRGNNIGYGFDPSYEGIYDDIKNLTIERKYFDGFSSPVDVVICRHVIEHMTHPKPLLVKSYKALKDGGLILFETPNIKWILQNQFFYDFFYEHCSYYSEESIYNLFSQMGFDVLDVHDEYNHQWMQITARKNRTANTYRVIRGVKPIDELVQLASDFKRQFDLNISTVKEKLVSMSRDGPVAVFGAGPKGSMLAVILDPERKYISWFVDLEPEKYGMFIPKTRHPIIAQSSIAGYEIKYGIVVNANYLEQINNAIQPSSVKLITFENMLHNQEFM